MSRLTSLLLAFIAFAGTVSAQLLTGTPPPPTTPAVPVPQPSAVVTPATSANPATANPNALVFDAETKEYNAKPGEMSAPFIFNVTNVSQTAVSINRLSTSCGCTVAQLPSQPY